MRGNEVDRIGSELGRDSCGVVTSRELRAARVDLSVVPRLVRAGRWTVVWAGTYVTRPGPVGPAAQAHAAVKNAQQRLPSARSQPAVVVTGLAGAAALGLRWVPEHTRTHVLVGPEVRRQPPDGVLVRRAHDLAELTTWSWQGLRVAPAERLVVDGARECASLRDVRGLVLGAVADGWTTAEELAAGAVGGTALARRAVGDAWRGAASPPEAELVDTLLGCGLAFYKNADVYVDGVFVARFDVYLVGTGVGGEMGSREQHGEEAALDDTLLRHDRVVVRGPSLVHTTPRRFRADPAGFVARLREAVATRHRQGLGEPPGLTVVRRGPLLR